MLSEIRHTKNSVLVAQPSAAVCDSMSCSPPGSSVHGILQASILEWVAIPFRRGSSQSRDQTWVSCIAGNSLPTEPPGRPLLLLVPGEIISGDT